MENGLWKEDFFLQSEIHSYTYSFIHPIPFFHLVRGVSYSQSGPGLVLKFFVYYLRKLNSLKLISTSSKSNLIMFYDILI